MPQITTGFRNFLSRPLIYDIFQSFLGVSNLRQIYASEYIKPSSKCRILDIGCGTSDILHFLPTSVDYYGYDLSPTYISAAKKKYNGRGTWFCDSVMNMQLHNFETFDIVLASGLLHHLSDGEANRLASIASGALKPGGRFCCLDNCYVTNQNPIARYLISKDRGQNVRKPEDYVSLVKPHFDLVEMFIRHDLLRVPYTHSIIVAKKQLT